MTNSDGNVYCCFSLDAVLFLLITSIYTQPTRSSGNKKCVSECKGRYDLCCSDTQNLNEYAMCFNAKLKCLLKCANQKYKRNDSKDHRPISGKHRS